MSGHGRLSAQTRSAVQEAIIFGGSHLRRQSFSEAITFGGNHLRRQSSLEANLFKGTSSDMISFGIDASHEERPYLANTFDCDPTLHENTEHLGRLASVNPLACGCKSGKSVALLCTYTRDTLRGSMGFQVCSATAADEDLYTVGPCEHAADSM